MLILGGDVDMIRAYIGETAFCRFLCDVCAFICACCLFTIVVNTRFKTAYFRRAARRPNIMIVYYHFARNAADAMSLGCMVDCCWLFAAKYTLNVCTRRRLAFIMHLARGLSVCLSIIPSFHLTYLPTYLLLLLISYNI